jgi:hypothetical protein
MNVRLLAVPLLIISSSAIAADLDAIPSRPIAVKKALLFSDDFQNPEHDKRWHRIVDTFTFENGALKGSQTREKDMPAPAVYGLDIPTKDSVVECRIRFDGAKVIDVEFDDRAFTGSHYGHLCRAQVHLDRVTILDERDGSQSNALIELRKDPEKNRTEIRNLLASHSASFPAKLAADKWYNLAVETVGDQMRVTIDGKPAGYLKSPGIGHPTKSKIELGVNGKDGWFDDIKVWDAEPAR